MEPRNRSSLYPNRQCSTRSIHRIPPHLLRNIKIRWVTVVSYPTRNPAVYCGFTVWCSGTEVIFEGLQTMGDNQFLCFNYADVLRYLLAWNMKRSGTRQLKFPKFCRGSAERLVITHRNEKTSIRPPISTIL